MKKIVQYQCEICKNRYKTEEEALNCELKGVFDFTKYPVGLLSKVQWNDNHYGIFVNAQTERYDNPHLASEKMWAYRSNENISDSKINLWEWGFCGSGFISDYKYNNFTKKDLDLRETKWLIKQLKMNNITPSYYEGDKLVKL